MQIKAGLPLLGNPAISLRPVAFRPRLATGLAFSAGAQSTARIMPPVTHKYHELIYS
jgi:hypothetical protein